LPGFGATAFGAGTFLVAALLVTDLLAGLLVRDLAGFLPVAFAAVRVADFALPTFFPVLPDDLAARDGAAFLATAFSFAAGFDLATDFEDFLDDFLDFDAALAMASRRSAGGKTLPPYTTF
jgi:hypothetical protein